ncbi:hypothetical protein [Mesorhizobium tianshanense]|uniref:Uncharacterized protein n=1 Tax=Mesorhizobium tianshanense TaxID=39844 RepID=A0A562P332_9HYPH|nr:hypothetical protein [Mesorhizobium tianshanense]TWI38809.1 hypothetical protein IQ26_02232 [Mesorhizobium tianshanense]
MTTIVVIISSEAWHQRIDHTRLAVEGGDPKQWAAHCRLFSFLRFDPPLSQFVQSSALDRAEQRAFAIPDQADFTSA